MARISKITPCLWYDSEAEPAARFYVSLFPDSGVDEVSRYGEEGVEIHGRPPGSVMTVSFRLAGQSFTALNGGPLFKLTEAVSFQVSCDTQAEVDRFWNRLSEGGQPGPCGWLKDRWGLSWQVLPSMLSEWMSDPDPQKAGRTAQAMMQMGKLDIAALRRAHEAG